MSIAADRTSRSRNRPRAHYHASRSPSVSQQPDGRLFTLPTDANSSIPYEVVPAFMSEYNFHKGLLAFDRTEVTRRPHPDLQDYEQLPERSADIELVRMLGLLLSHRQSRVAPRIAADVDRLSLPE